MMDYLVIFSFTLLLTIPLVGIFLYVFRENIVIPPMLGLGIAAALQVFFVFVAGGTVDRMDTYAFSKLISSVITVAFLWLLIILFTDLSKTQTLFVVLVMMSVEDDIVMSVSMVYKGEVSIEQVTQWGYVGWAAFFTALYVPFFYVLLKKEVQPLIACTRDYSMWKYMWLLPLFVFVMYRICGCPDYYNQGFIWHPSMYVLPYIWTGGSLGVFYFVLRSLRMTYERNLVEHELDVSELMSGAYAKQYTALQEQMDNERRNRHDFRHSLLMIQQYAQDGDCSKIQKHIQQYLDGTMADKAPPFCENIPLNTILKHFAGLAEKEGIRTEVKACVPQKLELTETEVCVLVGNLMENALEACRRQTKGERYILARLEKREKQMFFISVQNSYSHTIIEKQKKFISSKRNEYGIGMLSISHIVKQHEGMMRVQYSEGVFTVNVLMNC
mgnify:CR=1 FL=1